MSSLKILQTNNQQKHHKRDYQAVKNQNSLEFEYKGRDISNKSSFTLLDFWIDYFSNIYCSHQHRIQKQKNICCTKCLVSRLDLNICSLSWYYYSRLQNNLWWNHLDWSADSSYNIQSYKMLRNQGTKRSFCLFQDKKIKRKKILSLEGKSMKSDDEQHKKNKLIAFIV